MIIYLSLVKAGYGTLEEVRALDTPDLLDIVEFEKISADIEAHKLPKKKPR